MPDNKKARCQCDPDCTNPPVGKSPFCQQHKVHCWRKAKRSGSEPAFDPDKFNNHPGIKDSHNCYSYAMDHAYLPPSCTKNACSLPFPQPGRASGYNTWDKVPGKKCGDLTIRVLGDVPKSYYRYTTKQGKKKHIGFQTSCKKGFKKIAMVTDEDEDYHFYRQDSNGYWSHKPGSTDVTRKDALGHRIYDPELASRKYDSGLDYDNFCGYMCVPTRKYTVQLKGGTKRSTKRSTKRNKKRRST
jgi:hypothetical protein